MNKALFLDRDGVINIEKEYLYKIADFEFINGVFDTCKYFQDQGYLIVIITNQAGIARGKYTENDFAILNQWMLKQFTQNDIVVSQVYHCPHHPNFTGDCPCRKPNPGMLIEAQQAFQIDLNKSILVGDKEGDIQAGINAGIRQNILVRSGHPINETNTIATQIIDSIKNLPVLFS